MRRVLWFLLALLVLGTAATANMGLPWI